MTGLLALRIPASITAHAHPSTLLLALAWIGAIYVALALAVALLLVVFAADLNTLVQILTDIDGRSTSRDPHLKAKKRGPAKSGKKRARR